MHVISWKRRISDEAKLLSEKIKPVAIAIIELRLSEGISQSDNQSEENKIFKKLHSNLVQRFRVDLNTFLGLAVPNQYCPAVKK